MTLLRNILGSRRGMILVILAVAYVVWESWLSLHAASKVFGPFPGKGEKVNVLVTLPFPADRFHIQVFQGFGRVSGTEDNKVEVRGVKRADLARVARPYWVTRVEPLQQGG
jgi:hypothetical protein